MDAFSIVNFDKKGEACVMTKRASMTMDDTPRTRSEGKKGKGARKDDRIYSSKHVRLSIALQEKRIQSKGSNGVKDVGGTK